MRLFYHIIHGSSRKMEKYIPRESVHLVVTSPPYLDVKDYGAKNPDNIGNLKGTDYYLAIKDVLKECYRVLAPGRRVCWNVSDIKKKDVLEPLGSMTMDIAREVGFKLNEIIIWHKGRCRQVGPRGQMLGTWPYPGNPVLLSNYEWVLVFKKAGEVEWKKKYRGAREKSKLTTAEMRELVHTVWYIEPDPTERGYHPAPFPVELASRCIKLFTYVGDRVLEPFLGGGTTMVAAKRLQRSCWGFELEQEYVDKIIKRIGWGEASLHTNIGYELTDTFDKSKNKEVDVNRLKEGSKEREEVIDRNIEERDKQRRQKDLMDF